MIYKNLEWRSIDNDSFNLCRSAFIKLPFSKKEIQCYQIWDYGTRYVALKLRDQLEDEYINTGYQYFSIGSADLVEDAKKIAQKDWENTISPHFLELNFETIK